MEPNPFLPWVERFDEALRTGATLQVGPARPEHLLSTQRQGKALVFAPHPDDEAIIGALPLRLMRELRLDVVNVAVTLGSRKDRRSARWRELQAACDYLGFGLITPDMAGLEGINLGARQDDPARWRAATEAVAAILAGEPPSVLFMPHAGDWNSTHVGTHHLVVEALRRQPGLACQVVETEYWAAMDTPNLMIGSSAADVADLVAALSLHAGEVARNPYHLRLPAWMMDNVRRGTEVVLGQGTASPQITFATLYRLRRWAAGDWRECLSRGTVLGAGDSLAPLFATETAADPTA